MKERLNRFLSCLMAVMLFASTTSWTIGKHYCMGHLMNVSLYSHAPDCGMAMQIHDVDTAEGHEESSCCSDELIVVDGQDNLITSFDDIGIDHLLGLVISTYSSPYLLQFSSEIMLPNEYYPPPPLIKDIQLLDEVFLI